MARGSVHTDVDRPVVGCCLWCYSSTLVQTSGSSCCPTWVCLWSVCCGQYGGPMGGSPRYARPCSPLPRGGVVSRGHGPTTGVGVATVIRIAEATFPYRRVVALSYWSRWTHLSNVCYRQLMLSGILAGQWPRRLAAARVNLLCCAAGPTFGVMPRVQGPHEGQACVQHPAIVGSQAVRKGLELKEGRNLAATHSLQLHARAASSV